jgi:AI-2 transport protein TqsA
METSDRRIQTICLVILTIIVCGVVLHLLKILFLPFVLAVCISLGLSSFVGLLVQRLRLPITAAVGVTLLITLVLFWLVGLLLVNSVEQMMTSASVYEHQLNELVGGTLRVLRLQHFGVDPELLTQPLRYLPIQSLIGDLAASILDAASMSVMVFLYVLYLLFLLPQKRQEPALWRDIATRVRAFLIAKTAVSLLLGVLIGIALACCGVQFSMFFGLFACLLNFVPLAGPVVASLAPWPIILLSPDLSTPIMVIALLLPGALFFIVANFVEPRVLGRSVQIQPLAVLLALMFWGVLWGPLGIVLATPITGILALLASYFSLTRPVSNLLSGQTVRRASTEKAD